jgi:metal-responsive CopG/Arc/MetJ family transcriptional regulator
MSEKTKKATFNLPPDILAELDKVMAEGAAPSKNALVERALVKELKELRRQARKARWEEGAKDSALLKDISEIEVAYQSADAETAGRID